MDPMTVALISAAAFGGVVTLVAFLRQKQLSNDKLLNDKAQRVALSQEAKELEKVRIEMQNVKQFDSHYKVLGANKDAIAYLDSKIEEIFNKKSQIIDRYSQLALKESTQAIESGISAQRKAANDKLKGELDKELNFYDSELLELQKRRSSLWDANADLETYLLSQESLRSKNMDELYKQHSGILEKISIQHTTSSENVAKHSITAGTLTFKAMIMAPIQFLLQYFNISTGIDLGKSKDEDASRGKVDDAESAMNDEFDDDSEDEFENQEEYEEEEEDIFKNTLDTTN